MRAEKKRAKAKSKELRLASREPKADSYGLAVTDIWMLAARPALSCIAFYDCVVAFKWWQPFFYSFY